MEMEVAIQQRLKRCCYEDRQGVPMETLQRQEQKQSWMKSALTGAGSGFPEGSEQHWKYTESECC